MAMESPEMERRTSFVERLRGVSIVPLQPSPRLKRQEAGGQGASGTYGESKKNESTQCNNCSGSIIPTAEQIRLICVSTWTGIELLQPCCKDMIHCDVCAQENCEFISIFRTTQASHSSAKMGILWDAKNTDRWFSYFFKL